MDEKTIDRMFLDEDGNLLPELRRFNWGAFLLNWIWGLGNKTFITLIALAITCIPIAPISLFLNIFICAWFGVKGNEWALTNKKWKSVEHFQRVQRIWAIWGVIIHVIIYVLFIYIIIELFRAFEFG